MEIRVTTYDELAREYQDFAAGKFGFLVVVGERGIAKTQHALKYLPRIEDGGVAGWINGRLTGYGLYLTARDYRDIPIVIDDADDLFSDKAAITILKQLCGGDGTRYVSWATGTTMGQTRTKSDDDEEDAETAHQFSTRSPILILTNAWEARANPHVRAVGDRGTIVRFVPSPYEVHRYVGLEIIAKDARNSRGEPLIEAEVFAFVEEHLAAEPNLSIRHYIVASERLRLGRDWKKELVELWELDSPKAVARRLYFDDSLTSEKHRAELFEAQTGKSKARYHQIKGELKLPVRDRGGAREGAGRKPKNEEPEGAATSDQLTS